MEKRLNALQTIFLPVAVTLLVLIGGVSSYFKGSTQATKTATSKKDTQVVASGSGNTITSTAYMVQSGAYCLP